MVSSSATHCLLPTRPPPKPNLAAVVLALLLAAPACAADAPCPESNADECTRFTHIMAGMDSSDIATQLESVHAATQDLEPNLRALVIDKALKSNNARLRTAAVRYTIKAHSNLDVSLELPVHPTPGQQELYARQSALTLRSIAVADRSDEISGAVEGTRAHGSMISGGFELSWGYCRLRMTAGEEITLRGTLTCTGRDGPIELAASIELT